MGVHGLEPEGRGGGCCLQSLTFMAGSLKEADVGAMGVLYQVFGIVWALVRVLTMRSCWPAAVFPRFTIRLDAVVGRGACDANPCWLLPWSQPATPGRLILGAKVRFPTQARGTHGPWGSLRRLAWPCGPVCAGLCTSCCWWTASAFSVPRTWRPRSARQSRLPSLRWSESRRLALTRSLAAVSDPEVRRITADATPIVVGALTTCTRRFLLRS
jgi:hypothetical protein